MFDRFLDFLRQLPGDHDPKSLEGPDDPRVAAAALMVHVMDADGERTPEERERVLSMLSQHFDLSASERDGIFAAGEAANREAVDLYAFTSVIKNRLDHAARVEFIEILWEIVLADGELHELEDNIVWRVAELIAVEREERIAMRRKVQARTPGTTGTPGED